MIHSMTSSLLKLGSDDSKGRYRHVVSWAEVDRPTRFSYSSAPSLDVSLVWRVESSVILGSDGLPRVFLTHKAAA